MPMKQTGTQAPSILAGTGPSIGGPSRRRALTALALGASLFMSHFGFAEDAVTPASAQISTRPDHAMVIGFVGGFVRRDDQRHPELHLIRALEREHPDVYFALLENKKVGVAYHSILKRLGADEYGIVPEENKKNARILLFGHSWGASAAIALSRRLQRAGIPVTLTVQVDSVAKPGRDDGLIPANVLQAVNFYQARGLIRGRSTIAAADPARTTILGNFRREYKRQPEACRAFPWYARVFTKDHIAIECDPELWFEIRSLLVQNLQPQLALNASAQPVN
ncbi:MAG: hypothetical protein JO065_05650 [Acidobacteria bacterium]|nr:hypothetical protein [Acidobacteriota bacterium]